MNPNELRIGNWLIKNTHGRKEYIQVDSLWVGFADQNLINIHSEGSAYGDSSIEGTQLSDCEPIPLTTEILFSSGFKYINGRGKTGCYISDGIRINVDNISIAAIKTPNGRFMELIRFKYVHELQNLFFALNKPEPVFIIHRINENSLERELK